MLPRCPKVNTSSFAGASFAERRGIRSQEAPERVKVQDDASIPIISAWRVLEKVRDSTCKYVRSKTKYTAIHRLRFHSQYRMDVRNEVWG
jgi:hypothetical protein